MIKMVDTNNENVQCLLNGWDKSDINSSVRKKIEIDQVIKDLTAAKDIVTNEIKLYLKEKQWTKYYDHATKLSVNLDVVKRENIDRNKLKLLLSNVQYNSIIKITTYEKLSILTPEDRERLKKMIRKNL
jgi:hypothetical protein